MNTCPHSKDRPLIDTPPRTLDDWLHRGSALHRWARNPDNHSSIKQTIATLARLAFAHVKKERLSHAAHART